MAGAASVAPGLRGSRLQPLLHSSGHTRPPARGSPLLLRGLVTCGGGTALQGHAHHEPRGARTLETCLPWGCSQEVWGRPQCPIMAEMEEVPQDDRTGARPPGPQNKVSVKTD